MRGQILLIAAMWPWLAAIADDCGKHLVEVEYAMDDKGAKESFHSIATFWLSEKCSGWSRDVYDWAYQGGYSHDADAQRKAAKCRQLVQPLAQPKELPESPNHIVTVRCMDTGERIERRFPISRVPSVVREVLLLTGTSSNHFGRLTFTEEAEPSASANGATPRR